MKKENTVTKKNKLSKSMTTEEFENGYWYATEVKAFAEDIGIPSASKLRKDELEDLIQLYLKTGEVQASPRKNVKKTGIKDIELGLSLDLPIVHYTSNKVTKDFLMKEALKINPDLKKKSGVRYRLNRWRDEQITKGKKITYGDLVKQFVKLNQTEGKFTQVKVGRYINFISDYMAANKKATKPEILKAWKELKKMDIPKNYEAWSKHKKKR